MYKTGIRRLQQTLAELDEGPREAEEQHAQSQIQEIHRVSSHLSLSSLTSLRRVNVEKSSKSEFPMLSACQNPNGRACSHRFIVEMSAWRAGDARAFFRQALLRVPQRLSDSYGNLP